METQDFKLRKVYDRIQILQLAKLRKMVLNQAQDKAEK